MLEFFTILLIVGLLLALLPYIISGLAIGAVVVGLVVAWLKETKTP